MIILILIKHLQCSTVMKKRFVAMNYINYPIRSIYGALASIEELHVSFPTFRLLADGSLIQ